MPPTASPAKAPPEGEQRSCPPARADTSAEITALDVRQLLISADVSLRCLTAALTPCKKSVGAANQIINARSSCSLCNQIINDPCLILLILPLSLNPAQPVTRCVTCDW